MINPIDTILGTENSVLLIPAGWDWMPANEEELRKGWEDEEDFHIFRGPYCTIRDIEALRADYDHIWLRAIGVKDIEV